MKHILENDHNIVVFVEVFSYLGVTSATIKALIVIALLKSRNEIKMCLLTRKIVLAVAAVVKMVSVCRIKYFL